MKQLRIEGVERQKIDDAQVPVTVKSLAYDWDVSIRTRVASKKAAQSLVRVDLAIKESMETINIFRDWHKNLSSYCNKEIIKIAEVERKRAKNSSMLRVPKAPMLRVPKVAISKKLPTIME